MIALLDALFVKFVKLEAIKALNRVLNSREKSMYC